MTKRWVLALGVVVATTTSAFAKDEFDAYVADLAAGKASKHFEACQLLVTPGGQVRQPCTLARADLVGDPKATLTVKKNTNRFFPHSQIVWREAEVEARGGGKLLATFRVIEIAGSGGPGMMDGIYAAHWARLTPDKEAAALALAKALPTPIAVDNELPPDKEGSTQDEVDRRQAFETAYDWLVGDDDKFRDTIGYAVERGAIVFGSAAGQRYAGKSGVKAINGWKITLAAGKKAALGGNGWVLAGATTIVATPADKKAAPITYVLFTAFGSGLTVGGGSFVTEPALISFAVAR